MPEVVLFDVNETLVDLAALDEVFEETLGDASLRTAWFRSLLHTALRITATSAYASFAEVGAAALGDVAERRDQSLTGDERDAVLRGLRHLPAHPDAPPALACLREKGFRLAALTNSAPEAGREKLRNAELARFFEAVFSADEAGRLKPAPAPYRLAARRLGVETSDCWFVAAHGWDVAGARHAGCRAAFVAREGKRLGPLVEPPAVTGPNLQAVVDQLVASNGKKKID